MYFHSMWQTLEVSGKIRVVYGQNLKGDVQEPKLALFAICCPFGPLPLPEMTPREYVFKTKHKMDLTPVAMDTRFQLKDELAY